MTNRHQDIRDLVDRHRVPPCPFCEHWDLPIGCPTMDASGRLLTETECPSLCRQPGTHTLVTPVGSVAVCERHFKVALQSL